ncbi:metallophosphoesterase [Tianweitania sp. BSSL-BM11]|uniref:Metallophosphoesterase n=2 Tax=Tianweitania aestuarii TaxID=2814886 RepID=A0ABS5RQZ6_9HYPH|nr:metallophosphoesterase [Tianweitania aestuarii]MBS9719475.1 metallophosphoesterase [Tianweitania aestuarii]
MRIYAIGDVHGCADLLEALYSEIDRELERDAPEDWRIIHIGDYGDRGPDTKRALDLIIERRSDRRVLSLMGNHDEGWLTFLADPHPVGLFVAHGGDMTARSYGVDADLSDVAGRIRTRDELLAAMPQAHLDFLRGLPRSFSFGDYYFCHAGIRPGVELAIQDREDLIWIRKEFLAYQGLHPRIIVHGHTPSAEVEMLSNRINVDTGAVKTGVMTAVVLDGRTKRIIDVRQDRA